MGVLDCALSSVSEGTQCVPAYRTTAVCRLASELGHDARLCGGSAPLCLSSGSFPLPCSDAGGLFVSSAVPPVFQVGKLHITAYKHMSMYAVS